MSAVDLAALADAFGIADFDDDEMRCLRAENHIIESHRMMAAELLAWREVGDAIAAYRACREGMQPQNATLQRETRIALDAALARVPR